MIFAFLLAIFLFFIFSIVIIDVFIIRKRKSAILKHDSSPLVKVTKLTNPPTHPHKNKKRKCLVNELGSQVKARYTQAGFFSSSVPLIHLSFHALLPQSTPLYTLYIIAPPFSPFQGSWNKAKAGEPHGNLRFHSSSDLLP